MLNTFLGLILISLFLMIMLFLCYKSWFDIEFIYRIERWRFEQKNKYDPLPEPEMFFQRKLPLIKIYYRIITSFASIIYTAFLLYRVYQILR
jgi:hypothetical protein